MTSIFRTGCVALSLGLAPLAAHAQDAAERAQAAITTFDPTELERSIAEPGIAVTEGQAVYDTVCAGCHMPQGEGAVGAGAYPALSDNPNLEFPEYAINLVIYGQRGMPPFAEILDNEQVAAVVNYVQSDLNDYEPTATAETVAATRPETAMEGATEEHE